MCRLHLQKLNNPLKQIRINHVKKQIRILGIFVKKIQEDYIVIGVISRGAFWLDGVLSTITKTFDLTQTVIKMVKASSHLDQIRLIMINNDLLPENTHIDYEKLMEEIIKPIIVFESDMIKTYGVDRKTTERILKVSQHPQKIPESLRLARLIASSLDQPNIMFKKI